MLCEKCIRMSRLIMLWQVCLSKGCGEVASDESTQSHEVADEIAEAQFSDTCQSCSQVAAYEQLLAYRLLLPNGGNGARPPTNAWEVGLRAAAIGATTVGVGALFALTGPAHGATRVFGVDNVCMEPARNTLDVSQWEIPIRRYFREIAPPST